MSVLVAFQVGRDKKDQILLEAGPGPEAGRYRVGDPGRPGGVTRKGVADAIQQAGQSLEQALDRLRPAAQMIVEKLKSVSPDQVEVEFGVKLEAEAGAVITKAGTEAHFQITLKWLPAKAQ